jgi:HTH-type transcriptional regulator/antitoxin HigA
MTIDIKPIRRKASDEAALKAVESLMDARARSPEGERLDVLVTLIEAWEAKHFPLDLPDAVDAIEARKLHAGLGIPAESLLKAAEASAPRR